MPLDDWAQAIVQQELEKWEPVRFGKVAITIEGNYSNGQLQTIHVRPGGDAEHRRPPKDAVATK